ncbi:MAG: M23 family metallopeptidase [Acidobacteriota bacterium]|nr:M23 family metallopeptidase [Acidobacteriota bacterium]MDW3228776.1 M23 family metallopeptidase [Acidobacteriota bacterium]
MKGNLGDILIFRIAGTVRKKTVFWLAVFMVVAAANVYFPLAIEAAEVQVIEAQSGDLFELQYRMLQPGEPLVLVWKNQISEYAGIFFMEDNYWLKNKRENQPVLLLGLDVMAKPGHKALEIDLWSQGQKIERLVVTLEIAARDFPVRELTVDQKYVTPPKEVLARTKREAEILAMVYSVITPEYLAEGPFIMPCEGRLSPNFGQRRVYNKVPRSVHTGVDIAVPLGHPIKASNSGRVVLASDLYYSGKTVILDHGLGLFTSYSHLSKLLVKRGETVQTGQVIGLAGSTGLSTGPHLHWGAKIHEARVDPLSLLELDWIIHN